MCFQAPLICLFCLFGVLRRFQHCTGHITTGSWKGRGNQYIEFARVVYCKLPTNGKQLPAFPLTAMTGIEPRLQRWEARVLPLCHRGPSSTFEEHVERLGQVFDRLRQANLKLKPKKCSFGKKKIKFLGHLVSACGIEPLPEACQSVWEFPRPSTLRDVRSFLGLTSYYRRFIPQYSKKSKPLTNLTRKDVPFKWDDTCEVAFTTLKDALTSPPVLAYPRYQDPYILTVNSSGDSCGMVLSQIQDGMERVISYGAKKYSPAERNYGITEKEALACILGVKHYEPYLKATTFKIVTDHATLKWLLDQRKQAVA